MKKTCVVMMTLWALACSGLQAVAADASLDLSVYSHYVWRGQVLADGGVFQPSLTVSDPCGLSFNTWANYDFDTSEFNEADLTVSFAKDLCDTMSAEVGIVQYVLRTGDNTAEAFFSLAADVILSPKLTLYWDVDQVEDVYAQAAVSHDIELTEKLTLGLGASVGFGGQDYNAFYFGFEPEEGEDGTAIPNDSAAVNDANVSAGLTYAFSESLSLGANAQYTALLDSDIKKGAKQNFSEKDVVFGSVTLSRSF